MESTLVRRDQFNITPQGIVHKPTDAAFTPDPGDPYSGIERLGQLCNEQPNGGGFRTEDVQRMMRSFGPNMLPATRISLNSDTSAWHEAGPDRESGSRDGHESTFGRLLKSFFSPMTENSQDRWCVSLAAR